MPAIHPIVKHMDSFTFSGLTVRTKNSDEFNQETAKLPNLWEQFYVSNPAPNTTIFAVYSDYESDVHGLYNVTVGTVDDTQSAALNAVKIHAGQYLVFQTYGAMPQAVIEAWKQIWDYFTKERTYQRCFMTDFEAYNHHDEVAIYIGVK